jgi:hypothetical protein
VYYGGWFLCFFVFSFYVFLGRAIMAIIFRMAAIIAVSIHPALLPRETLYANTGSASPLRLKIY